MDLFFYKDLQDQLKSKLYDKRDYFSFDIVNYPFLDGNIPRNPAYGVYISRLLCFARACSDFFDFAKRHNALVQKLLTQGYKVCILRKHFITNHADLVSGYNIQLSLFFKNNLPLC